MLESGLLAKEGNGNYINLLSQKTLSQKDIQAILATEQGRARRFDEVAAAVRFFFEPTLSYEAGILVWKKGKPADVAPILSDVMATLDKLTVAEWTPERIQAVVQDLVKATNRGVGDVFWPFRVALTGKTNSPSPQDVAAILGKAESLRRLSAAKELASKLA